MALQKKKHDIIFFDDGCEIKRKEGVIKSFHDGFVHFSEHGKIQLIPIYRIIRIEKRGDYFDQHQS